MRSREITDQIQDLKKRFEDDRIDPEAYEIRLAELNPQLPALPMPPAPTRQYRGC